MSKTGIVEVKNAAQTKYWIGDKIWVWGNTAPKELAVEIVAIQVFKDAEDLVTVIPQYKMSDNCWWSESKVDEAAKTKEELRIRIFGE